MKIERQGRLTARRQREDHEVDRTSRTTEGRRSGKNGPKNNCAEAEGSYTAGLKGNKLENSSQGWRSPRGNKTRPSPTDWRGEASLESPLGRRQSLEGPRDQGTYRPSKGEQVRRVLKSLKSGKAKGPDGWTPRELQALPAKLDRPARHLLQRLGEKGVLAPSIRNAVVALH